MLDGRNDPTRSAADAAAAAAAEADDEAPLMTAPADDGKDEDSEATDEDWHSITDASQPLTNDRSVRTTSVL